MKKLLVWIALALLLGMPLTSCGGQTSETTETTPATGTESTAETTQAPKTTSVTKPVTTPTTLPTTKPTTAPQTTPGTTPMTLPTTKPVTEPQTTPVTTPETKPAPVEGQILLDFDTDSEFLTYMENAGAGLIIIGGEGYNGGEIRDDMYYNSGVMCIIEDTTKTLYGGLDTGKLFNYTIEFQIKFESFKTKDNNTVLNIHAYKEDGKTIADWNKRLCVDGNGTFHLNTDPTLGMKLELDTWYTVKLEMDIANMLMKLSINGTDCGSTSFPFKTETGHCGIRFGNGGGAKFYMDNFSITKK